MITYRHTTKWIALVMAVAVCLCLAAVACPEQIKALAGETGVSMEYETALFNTDEVMQVNILMDSDDWDEMLENAWRRNIIPVTWKSTERLFTM